MPSGSGRVPAIAISGAAEGVELEGGNVYRLPGGHPDLLDGPGYLPRTTVESRAGGVAADARYRDHTRKPARRRLHGGRSPRPSGRVTARCTGRPSYRPGRGFDAVPSISVTRP